ncbi:hypothetical protein BS78_02G333900, partial [Paspalum vaginatum]
VLGKQARRNFAAAAPQASQTRTPARRYKATRALTSHRQNSQKQKQLQRGATHARTSPADRSSRGSKASAREQYSKLIKAMEGLIPFLIDVVRKSQGRSGYRSVSSDGGSSRGGGSRRHLIDYWELPDAAGSQSVAVDRPSSGAMHRGEEHGRPAPVVAGSAYRRK